MSDSGSDDLESAVSVKTKQDFDPEPLSQTPSPYLSREFYLECIKITVEKVRCLKNYRPGGDRTCYPSL